MKDIVYLKEAFFIPDEDHGIDMNDNDYDNDINAANQLILKQITEKKYRTLG